MAARLTPQVLFAQIEGTFFFLIRKTKVFCKVTPHSSPPALPGNQGPGLELRSPGGGPAWVRAPSKGTGSDFKRYFCKAATFNTCQSREETGPPLLRLASGHVSCALCGRREGSVLRTLKPHVRHTRRNVDPENTRQHLPTGCRLSSPHTHWEGDRGLPCHVLDVWSLL